MKRILLIAMLLSASNLLVYSNAYAGKSSAEALVYNCSGCHGTNGVSNGPATPSLAGMSARYLVKAMSEYKAYEREGTIMNRIAMGYDRHDFAKMGAFFAAQARPKAKQTPGNLTQQGAAIHKDYCGKCHHDKGTRASDDSGFLSGQWTPYLKHSLEDALDGTRQMKKKMMRKLKAMHEKEGDAGIQALLDFYASQN